MSGKEERKNPGESKTAHGVQPSKQKKKKKEKKLKKYGGVGRGGGEKHAKHNNKKKMKTKVRGKGILLL